MKTIELRKVASKILADALHGNAALDEALDRELAQHLAAGNGPDSVWGNRAWIYDAASQALRFLGRSEYILKTHSTKKIPTGNVRRLLDIAIAQMIAGGRNEETPSGLIVSETVQAIRENNGEQPAKFANAILRKVAEERTQWRDWEYPANQSPEMKAAWASLPLWLWKLLVLERGEEWTRAFAVAALERPKIWYRKLGNVPDKTLELVDGYQGNEVAGFVQDLGNQKLCECALPYLSPDKTILDLCSAPGGKSVFLADAGFRVVATDVSKNRLAKVSENRNRLGLQDKIEIREWENVFQNSEKWDALWLDAPCTSFGIMGRHPEIKWNRGPESVEENFKIQKILLEWALDHLNPNGVLVYSLCSPLRLEKDAMKKVAGFEQLQVLDRFESNFEADLVNALILRK